jgi:hypothetical protein
MINHGLKRLGIQPPPEWREFHGSSGLTNQWRVPEVVIPSIEERAWVAAMVQGEGTIESHYVKASDSTTLDLDLKMTDSEPVFRFADLCGLPRPARPRKRQKRWQPLWRKNISGIRALRVLKEIQPFLVGQKYREAQKALEFFDSNGYRRGCFWASVIWPPDEFPLRRHPVKDGKNEATSQKIN